MPEQDPLAQLRGIHLPDAISAWPPAPGWWLLAFMTLAVLAFGLYQLIQWRRRNHYRRQAIAQLTKLTQPNVPSNYLQQLNQLLKQTALCAYPAADIAGLSGEAWLSFLDSSGKTQAFSQGAGRVLLTGPYAANSGVADSAALQQLAGQWIKQHRRRYHSTAEVIS